MTPVVSPGPWVQIWSSAKLSHNHHHRGLPQASLLQIFQEHRQRPIQVRHQVVSQVPVVFNMCVPLGATGDVAAFHQAPSQQKSLADPVSAVFVVNSGLLSGEYRKRF